MTITAPSTQTTVVRPIMPKQSTYIVPTRLLAVAVAHAVAEAWNTDEPVSFHVDAALTRYDVRPASGNDVAARIVKTLADERVLQSNDPANKMVSTVWNIILSEFGQRVSVRGWIAGHLTGVDGNHKRFVELTGEACPNCQLNPSCTKINRTQIQCLNQEDCGWRIDGSTQASCDAHRATILREYPADHAERAAHTERAARPGRSVADLKRAS